MKQVQNRVNLLTWQRGKGMGDREEGGGMGGKWWYRESCFTNLQFVRTSLCEFPRFLRSKLPTYF